MPILLIGFHFVVGHTAIADAQSAKDLIGTWVIVSNVYINRDGERVDAFGPTPMGNAIFARDGHFSLLNLRRDLPRFASHSRLEGTPEENRAIVQGSFAMYGTYSVKDNVLTMKVEGSTWPSWIGTEQRRAIAFPASDEFKWTGISPGDDATEVDYKRVR